MIQAAAAAIRVVKVCLTCARLAAVSQPNCVPTIGAYSTDGLMGHI